jgi:predicted N-acetyltransferase YhbS
MHPVAATPADRPAIEALLDAAFGADRHSKTAYRLREGNARLDALSYVMRRDDDGHLCGSIEFWPIALSDVHSGGTTPAVLLGPIAVSEACRGQGVGKALMDAGLRAAAAAGHATVILVGDASYYERFGFSAALTGGWQMPGPHDPARLLALHSGSAPLPRTATLCQPSGQSQSSQSDEARPTGQQRSIFNAEHPAA